MKSFDKPDRDLIGEVTNLFKLILVNPATDAISERSLSTMRRIKTWLRSTMTQKRLNNLAVLNIHKEMTDEIHLFSIANDFVLINTNRKRILGTFTADDF